MLSKLPSSILLLFLLVFFQTFRGYSENLKLNTIGPLQEIGASCDDPIMVAVQDDCSSENSIFLDFTTATDIDASNENPTCDGFGNFGYFLSFTAPAAGSVTFSFGGNADQVGLEVYETCGGTSLGCYNNLYSAGESSDLIGGLVPGNTYVAVVWRDTSIGTAEVCIEATSDCPSPSALHVDDITQVSAELSWVDNSFSNEWILEWGVSGFAQGTGNIINGVVENPYNLTGLTSNTTYDFYVSAVCTNENSNASSVFTFTTAIQLDYIIDCVTEGPINQNYCYGNNNQQNPEILTFTSTDGTPLFLTFNSGFVEDPFDEFVVIDSDGTPFPGYAVTDNNYGNNGDLSGLSFQSTGDTISFYVNSDSSISCASSAGNISNGIDFTVSCATCINPTASFNIVDDCANGEQFLVDIDITSLGDATSLTISNNFDDTTSSANAEGTYQVGPFPFTQDIIISLSNDQDANCVLSSNPLEVLFCPPPNNLPCNATILNNLEEEVCDYFGSGTILGASSSGVPNGTCEGEPDDDVWFQFEATFENEIISIQNVTGGTFDLDHAVYEGTCDNLIERYCSDINSSVMSGLTIGETYFIRVFSGGTAQETSTFDICLTQAPNNISCEEAEPFCSLNGGLSTANTIGVPSQGSIGCLFLTPNPTWNTLQIGSSGRIEIEIAQTDPNGNGLDVDFILWGPFSSEDNVCDSIQLDCGNCPNNTTDPNFYPFENIVDCSYSAWPVENLTIEDAQYGEVYVLLVTNFSNIVGTITLEQTNIDQTNAGSLTAELQVDLGPDLNVCESEQDTVTLIASSPFADTYEWFLNGVIIPEATDQDTVEVTETGLYTVQAYNENCDVMAEDDISVSFLDCSQVGLINIYAYNDLNNNMQVDPGEANFTNGYFTYELNNDGVINVVESSTGAFTLASDDESNTYDINYYFYDDYEDCYDVSAVSYNAVSVPFGDTVDVAFPIVDQGNCEDIGVYLINQQAPRPGFTHLNYLIIENFGLNTVSGTVNYLLDANLEITNISAGSAYSTVTTASGFDVSFFNLAPGESITITVDLLTPVGVPLDTLVTNTATYVNTGLDMVPENDESSVTEVVIGSFDPNDKMESHGPEVIFDDFVNSDEWLYYTIRFQNVGTAEAIFVRIEDAIDSQLDETTFQMLRSSHDYVVTRVDNNIEWFFDNIYLPAEQNDPEGSIGYVYFRIKPKSGYALGDVIPNSAAIYFDFNAPIITNTFTTTFVEALSVDEFSSANLRIYPNPANSQVIISLTDRPISDLKVTLLDVQGKVIYTPKRIANDGLQLNVSALNSGLYFVKIQNNDREFIQKLIIN